MYLLFNKIEKHYKNRAELMHEQNFCKPNSSLNGLGMSCQLFAKFRLQRSVSDAGGKPIKKDLTISFIFVFDACGSLASLVVED